MTKHALLSASSADRWLNCTPSARLNEKLADTSSVYAAEGTLAHTIGEIMLRLKVFHAGNPNVVLLQELVELSEDALYYQGMKDEVEEYVNYCLEQFNAAIAKSSDAKIFLEERLDFSKYVPEGFGTGDCVIIAGGELEIIDLKFGKGVEVNAVDNPQLMLYALGALERYGWIYGIEKVTMTIAQVRLNNISSHTISTDMLEAWAEENVRPKAEMAFKGKGETEPGPWCGFCKVRNTCKARAEAYVKHYPPKAPGLMSPEELAKILDVVEDMAKWAREVKEYALEEALKGTKFPGYKLVEGRSNRTITDEEKLAELLLTQGYTEDKIYKPKALEGITALEKVIGKKRFGELAESFIIKPAGKPTLVTEDDKRPEIDSVEDEFFN